MAAKTLSQAQSALRTSVRGAASPASTSRAAAPAVQRVMQLKQSLVTPFLAGRTTGLSAQQLRALTVRVNAAAESGNGAAFTGLPIDLRGESRGRPYLPSGCT